MDTIIGKDLKSVCLILTKQLTKFEIVRKLKDRTSNEVVKVIRNIFKTTILKKIVKGIITDQGKEFSEWKQIKAYIVLGQCKWYLFLSTIYSWKC